MTGSVPIESIAQAIHECWRREAIANGDTVPTWQQLDESHKESSRDQARRIPDAAAQGRLRDRTLTRPGARRDAERQVLTADWPGRYSIETIMLAASGSAALNAS